MLRKSGIDALKALLELALAPETWRSTKELAHAQDLPAPMLEQLLLRLRRAGLIEARRGRQGGWSASSSLRSTQNHNDATTSSWAAPASR